LAKALKTLVMMPTFNEVSGLRASVGRLLELNPNVDVLIIDDNSPDGTGRLADQLASDQRVNVLHRAEKQGLGKAYMAGYSWGIERGYDKLVQMDADGSHRPEDLAKLLTTAADLVIGSRWISGGAVENWPKYRQLISQLGNRYASFTTGIKLGDLTAGYRSYSASALRSLDLDHLEAQGYGFQIEMTRRVMARGLSVTEVPIRFVERENGRSKMTYAIIFEAFWLCTKWGFARLTKR
jgi:glycosyltransferase involved in cell wall biosynthesis